MFIEHRIVNHETTLVVPTPVDIILPTNSMATTTTTQPLLPPATATNSTVFTYRSAAAGGNPVRQRAIAEPTSNSLLISAERFKTNMTTTTTIRQTRQTFTNTTSIPTQPPAPAQRNIKSRIQPEKIVNPRGDYFLRSNPLESFLSFRSLFLSRSIHQLSSRYSE